MLQRAGGTGAGPHTPKTRWSMQQDISRGTLLASTMCAVPCAALADACATDIWASDISELGSLESTGDAHGCHAAAWTQAEQGVAAVADWPKAPHTQSVRCHASGALSPLDRD